MRNFITIILILNIICCSPSHQQPSNQSPKKETFLPPTTTIAGSPIVVNTDTCSPPRCIAIPTKSGSYQTTDAGVTKPIPLSPPDTTPAEFYVGLQNFNTDKGLALSSILCSFKDHYGNLWIGTDGGGASRYDGKSFTNYTIGHGLAGNSVYCITEDKNGNIWFGTNGAGVSKFNGTSFTTFSVAQGIANNSVHYITQTKDNRLWMVTDSGVCIYDGKSFTNFKANAELAGSNVLSITEDNSGSLWFGTSDKGVFVCSMESCINYSVKNGLADNNVHCITQDKNGTIWIGCKSGLTTFDGKLFSTITITEGLTDNNILCLTIDRYQNIWIGTDGGVNMYDGKRFLTIAYCAATSITEDNSGNLWFGTSGEGLYLYSYSGCTSTTGMKGAFINSISKDKSGNIWFGTGRGVTRYSGNNFVSYSDTQGLAGNNVLSIAESDSGILWFGTRRKGISSYDGKCFTTYTNTNGLADTTVWVITKDRVNNIWLGTNKGVTLFDGKYFRTYTTEQGLSNNKVRTITEDAFGNLWFGTDGGGACCFNGKSFTTFTTKQGLANNSIFCITKDKSGHLWFGTAGGGISLLSIEVQNKLKLNEGYDQSKFAANESYFKNFTTKEDLATDVVYDIVENKKGDIIVGTNEGFTFLKDGYDDAYNKFGKNKIEYFNQKYGFSINDVNVNAMFVDDSDIVWAGTGDKLVRFDYNAINKTQTKPVVTIQSLKLNNQNISWYDLMYAKNKSQNSNLDSIITPANITEESIVFGRTLSYSKRDSMCITFADVGFDSITPFYPLPKNLVLPCKFNNITFDFAAIEPARSFLVRYQFMLDGYDKTWNPLTEKTNASYGNLFEGNYKFRLKAISPDEIMSDEVIFSFKVLPPWYRTLWAYVLYIVAFISALTSFIKWRELELKKDKARLEIKVEQRTSELKKEKERSEGLLLNILPEEIADELKKTGTAQPKDFDLVTVLFTDFKNFTNLSEQKNAQQLVNMIDYYYSEFDRIITKYGIEKIKTIGDSYMCAGGIPIENKNNPEETVKAALEIRDFIQQEKEVRQNKSEDFFDIRIGLHTGPVVAGIVGVKKYAYDIWGDTVNIASRMESSGEPGKVNISGTTYELVKDRFKCIHRGKIKAKNKGEIDMYFVENR